MAQPRQLVRVINSTAPMRVCDNGGWTDTWFAEHGRVFNIAVHPCAQVQLRVFDDAGGQPRVTISAENYGERYQFEPGHGKYGRHPLLEAAVDFMGIPDAVAIDANIFSEAPAGCSTGTSAAVSVALIGALDRLRGGAMTAHEAAATAQRIETERLGQQCGIQDQLAAAFGGINVIDMHAYPEATVTPVAAPPPILWELEQRLSLVFVGLSHSSSDVHQMVIRSLEDAGPTEPRLDALRQFAEPSAAAVREGDFNALGEQMIANTEAQRALHPELIGERHQRVIDIARAHGAIGWKVNGAGGDGGSVTLLADGNPATMRAALRAIAADNDECRSIPIRLAGEGLRVWETA